MLSLLECSTQGQFISWEKSVNVPPQLPWRLLSTSSRATILLCGFSLWLSTMAAAKKVLKVHWQSSMQPATHLDQTEHVFNHLFH